MTTTIHIGDTLAVLRTLPSESVHCVVTSPPYWGLRDYGVEGQIGLEPTPAEFIAKLVTVFREVRRVLRSDGTCWINMGDSYANDGKWGGSTGGKHASGLHGNTSVGRTKTHTGLKPKDLMMMPHRLAIALQDDGWWVRQDIVWSKPNPMPESVRDRCTKSHEYIFLLTKSERYYYNADAIKEPVVGDPDAPRNRWDTKDYDVPGQKPQKRTSRGVGFGHGTDAAQRHRGRVRTAGNVNPAKSQIAYEEGDNRHRTKAGLLAYAQRTRSDTSDLELSGRNKRSVWMMATHSFPEAHFATFPPELPETCIKAGCPPDGIVLDPFFGAGTTGLVADRLQCDCIGIELNPAYAEMARRRIQAESTLFADVVIDAPIPRPTLQAAA